VHASVGFDIVQTVEQTATVSALTSDQRRLRRTLTLSFLVGVNGLSAGLVIGELQDEFGISGFLAAAHTSSFGFALIVMAVVGPRLAEDFGRTVMLHVNVGLVAAGVAMLIAGPAWPITLCGSAIAALGSAGVIELMPGATADGFGEHRSRVYAQVNAFPGVVGVMLALAIGFALRAGGTWRTPFTIVAASAIAIYALSIRNVRLPAVQRLQPARAHTASTDTRPLDVRTTISRGAAISLAVIVDFPPAALAPLFLKEVGGASDGAALILGSAWGLCILASRLSIHRLQRRVGPWMMPLVYAMVATGVMVMWLGPSLTIRFVAMLFVAFAGGASFPVALDNLYHQLPHVDPTRVGTIATFSGGIAITVGTLSLGALTDWLTLRHAMLVIAAAALLGLVLTWPRHVLQGADPPRK
jgi:predicted MFS family arabinose efflux permease